MLIDKSKVRIGSDFEMFLMNKVGKVLSAIPFNRGTKAQPEELERKGCCIQRDGVLQECNVPPAPLDGAKEFWDNISYVKLYIKAKFANKNDLELVCCPSAEVDDDQLIEDEAKEFGCSPDYNAWQNGDENPRPESEGVKLRSCGGHIHISYPGADVETSILLMKLFDLHLTVPFVIYDRDTERRKLYGKAGAFRLCNFGDSLGFEARTLSNVWVNSKEYVDYIFHQLNCMFDHFNKHGSSIIDQLGGDIISAINTSDPELAGEICEKAGILLLMENTLA